MCLWTAPWRFAVRMRSTSTWTDIGASTVHPACVYLFLFIHPLAFAVLLRRSLISLVFQATNMRILQVSVPQTINLIHCSDRRPASGPRPPLVAASSEETQLRRAVLDSEALVRLAIPVALVALGTLVGVSSGIRQASEVLPLAPVALGLVAVLALQRVPQDLALLSEVCHHARELQATLMPLSARRTPEPPRPAVTRVSPICNHTRNTRSRSSV